MHLSLSIITGSILCGDIFSASEQKEWSSRAIALPKDLPSKFAYIPMMQARRMSKATGLACENFLTVLNDYNIASAVFLSEHGELERSHKILESITCNSNISPTDFSMSVHNVAAGLSTILSKKNIEVSSISAGKNGLLQALYEVIVLLESGADNVLLVAFDGAIPQFYFDYGVQNGPVYAVSLLFEKGDDWKIKMEESHNNMLVHDYPLPIQFMHAWLSGAKKFQIEGVNQSSSWEYNG